MGGVVNSISNAVTTVVNVVTGAKKYQHLSYTATIVRDDAPVSLAFNAAGNMTVDSIRIMLGNAGGNVATVVTLAFYDVLQNRRIGNAKTVNLAAGAAYAANVITGFAAGLQKTRQYALVISSTAPNPAGLTAPAQGSATYLRRVEVGGFAYGAIPAQWRINLSTAACIPLGGFNGYQASGTAYRSLDVCSMGQAVPTGNGIVSFSDIVPTGTTLTITAYYTNDPLLYAASGVVGWTLHGTVASGDTVPAARYWRLKMDFTSNATNDETPRLIIFSIMYLNDPLVFSTHAQRVQVQGYGNNYMSLTCKAVHSISTSSSALESKAKTIMIGAMTIELAPEDLVAGMFSRPLRGKHVMIRVGYSDVPSTIVYYSGIVRDIAYSKQKYALTIQDPIEIANVSVPRDKHPLWDVATAYVGGNIVTYGDKSWLCLVNNTGNQPDISPTFWQDNGTVWIDIVYPSGTHLCDIAIDILQNQINLPSERIDIVSINAVKTAKPLLTIAAQKTISTQTNALDMLSEIAWLLESYWTMKEGRFSLIAEADTTTPTVEAITSHDIKDTLQYRRGWAELKNECLILTGYSGTGTGAEQFANGIAVADATSITDHQMTSVYEFKDKWGIAQSTLTTIATSFVNKWKDGRRIVRVDASMRLLPVEVGDVVSIKSQQLPQTDIVQMNGIIMQKDINWLNQTLTLTLLEVK